MSDVDALLAKAADDPRSDLKAIAVMRRGLRQTPSIKRPLIATMVLSTGVAAARLAIPVLVQQVIDRGLLGADGYRPGLILAFAGATLALVLIMAVVSPFAEMIMVRGAQESLYTLRRQAFAHIHRLSLGDHSRAKKGTLLARVTSDIESLSRFVEWGAFTWAINVMVIIGAVGLMLVYSWQLAIISVVVMLGVVPFIRFLQRRQLRAYSNVRTVVASLLSTFNEVITGGDAIRSYGYEGEAEARLDVAIGHRYQADMRAARYSATLFTVGDFIGSLALVVVALSAAEWGEGWGLSVGGVISFFFLLQLVQTPIGEITEVLDQTQEAVAGWDKVLTLLDEEPEVTENHDGLTLPGGPLAIDFDNVSAGYDGTLVLHDVAVSIAAGTRVAVVGETGSGKTTFARLLCRLIEPASGSIALGGVELDTVSPTARRQAVRLVPQDGFLFDTTVGDNIAYGRDGADRVATEQAIAGLGLEHWVAGLGQGIDTPVGPRGEFLSVGERQLVALARAQVADPGLLVLDEATSSVDPETEQALAQALHRLAAGRTVVSIAHRLSTAEIADLVLVFDQGRVVETGHHTELIANGGVYANLYASWERSTRE